MNKVDLSLEAQAVVGQRLEINIPGKEERVQLTERESLIVACMMAGKRAKEIAWELNNSVHTVNSHLANIKEKFGCGNNFQMGFILGQFVAPSAQKSVTIH